MSTLYYGGDIVTMTAPDARAQALLAADDGTIAFVGDLDEARTRAKDAARDTGRAVDDIDLDGACLMPGLIDAHSHFTGMAQRFMTADLSGARDFDDIVARLADFANSRRMDPGGAGDVAVIIGSDYDQTELAERQHPDRRVLDRVSTELPVLINHVSGHVCVCNTKLLEIAGIDAGTPDPVGGRYGRETDGTPDGCCEEPAAVLPVSQCAGELGGAQRWADYLGDIQDEYLSHGITTCQDGATVAGYDDQLIACAERGGLRLDLVSYPMIGQPIETMLASHEGYVGPDYRDHFRFGGVKMFLDGSPQARGAWLSEPYLPIPGSGEPEGFRGNPTMSDEAAYGFILAAIDAGRQVLAHCNGDAAAEQYITQYEAAFQASDNPHKTDLRPVMIHCQLTRKDQYQRMAAIGMIPSLFISHCWYWGDAHLANLGTRRGSHIAAARDAFDCGLPVTFHTDSPIVPPDLLFSAWCACERVTKRGVALDPLQRIGVWEACSAITRNAAYQYGEEQRKGTLQAGKLADLVVLDANPLGAEVQADPGRLKSIGVLHTIKEGSTVWSA
jgi:predicted amidohydrolase YtcJ